MYLANLGGDVRGSASALAAIGDNVLVRLVNAHLVELHPCALVEQRRKAVPHKRCDILGRAVVG